MLKFRILVGLLSFAIGSFSTVTFQGRSDLARRGVQDLPQYATPVFPGSAYTASGKPFDTRGVPWPATGFGGNVTVGGDDYEFVIVTGPAKSYIGSVKFYAKHTGEFKCLAIGEYPNGAPRIFPSTFLNNGDLVVRSGEEPFYPGSKIYVRCVGVN